MRRIQIEDPDAEVFAKVDAFSSHLITMGEVHAHIHAGIFFATTYSQSIHPNNNAEEVLIITSGAIHLQATATLEGESQVTLFEGTTVSANGTALTPVNRNRLSGKVTTASMFSTPTVDTDGTTLFDSFLPGGSGGNAVGGQFTGFAEWLLAPSTNYLVRFLNLSGGTRKTTIGLHFYEPSL